MDKRKRIALWLELHGPGLKARGIKWQYHVDTDVYTFYRETEVTGDLIADASSQLGSVIVGKLNG